MLDVHSVAEDATSRIDDEKSFFNRIKIFTKKCIFLLFIPIVGGEDAFPISIKMLFYIIESM